MKKLILTLFFLVIFTQLFSQTDERWVIVTNDLESDIYIDKQTITQNGDIFTFWRLDKYYKPKGEQKASGEVFLYDEARVQEYYNARTSEIKLKRAVFYYEGSPVYFQDFPYSEWSELVPDTIGEAVCGYVLVYGVLK